MNKTLVTDTMCIIHTFHFTSKAVRAFIAWSHTTLDRDCITSENISILRRCGLWIGKVEMKPKVLPKELLVIPELALLCLSQQHIPHHSLRLPCSSAWRTKPRASHCLLKRDATQLLIAWPDFSQNHHTLPTSISLAVPTAYYSLIIFLP